MSLALVLIAAIAAMAVFASWLARHSGFWLMHRSIGSTCPHCSGMGSTEDEEVCPVCSGRRYVWSRRGPGFQRRNGSPGT